MTLVCRDLDLDVKRYPPRAILNWVSNAKNELQDPEDAAKALRVGGSDGPEETYVAAYAEYQRRLRQANALDFDDLLMMTVHLFRAFPDVRENWRRRFRHVLVDEYQDTNHAQYALIHELCANSLEDPLQSVAEEEHAEDAVEPAELMVVGDADQSIYAFRGANIRNIMDFELDFPNARIVMLEQNYRSTQTILTAANAVISRNEARKPKNLWSDAGPGEGIVGYVGDDERDEARFVAEEIDKLTDAGVARAGDVAVFYRTNAQSRVFEEVFIRVGMPYRVVGGVRFYERREVRDALAYLRVLANPADSVSLRRILNTPKRGIGERAEACIEGLAAARPDHLLGGAAARGGRPGAGQPVAERDPRLRRPGRAAPVDGGGGGAGRRRTRAGADAQRLPQGARGLRGPAGRDPGGEPRRARRRRPRVRRRPAGRPVRRPCRGVNEEVAAPEPPGLSTSSSGSRWSPTPTRSPTHRTRRRVRRQGW